MKVNEIRPACLMYTPVTLFLMISFDKNIFRKCQNSYVINTMKYM